MKTYEFKDKDAQTKEATQEITKWLEDKGYTVKNVEGNKFWQKRDVDLLVFIPNPETGRKVMYQVELKIDFQRKYGNFIFETLSCVETGSEGCFMYTGSNYIFYYFYPERELYTLPTIEVRNWFKPQMDKFYDFTTSTPRYNGQLYHTQGKKVPIKKVLSETSTTLENLSDYFK